MPKTVNEEQSRINALRRYQILDTPPDGAFDRITALASQLLNVPIAIVSLVDTDRIWFKSHHGLNVQEVDRVPGLCASAILDDVPYIVNDASLDPRTLANPLVAKELGFRFYSGIPLVTRDQHNLGVLCVIDFQPRTITDQELGILKTLAQIVMDEIELRLSARRINELNNEMELLIHYVGEGVYKVDRDFNLTIWNEEAERVTGFSREEMLNHNSHLMFHHSKKDGSCFQEKECPIFQSIHDGVTKQVSEDIFWRKDGMGIPVEYISTPIMDNGQVTGAVVIFKDITEKKKSEEMLRRSNNLKTVGQLAAGVAHEIRNPLTTIKGFLQLLEKESNKHYYFNIMNEEINRIEFITTEFLKLSKPQSVQFAEKNVVPVLVSIKKLLDSEAILNNISIVFQHEKQIPSIYCDEMRIKQVFINVVKNAIEASPEGGTVTIQCKKINDHVLIRVIDHGSGIDDGRLKYIGGPYYSTKEKGTGIGLMVSYKIVQEHHGEIIFKSEWHKGTTVDIMLPAYYDSISVNKACSPS